LLPPFRRIVIETSGLADPGPILQTFATDRALGAEFHVEVALAVVDAVTGAETLDWSPEARKQVILADRLIVSKTDLADSVATASLTARLAKLNPRAKIASAVNGALDPDCLIDEAAAKPPRHGFAAEAVHADGIVSFVLTEKRPVDWTSFARAMETLIALRGRDLLRVKGFLDVAGCRGPVLVQFVQHLAHPPVELQAWPDRERGTRLVFIARALGEAPVRALFGAVRGLIPPLQGEGGDARASGRRRVGDLC
jgi:G3E family GTPase